MSFLNDFDDFDALMGLLSLRGGEETVRFRVGTLTSETTRQPITRDAPTPRRSDRLQKMQKHHVLLSEQKKGEKTLKRRRGER